MKTLPILQDIENDCEEMTTKEYIHQLKMALIHANGAQKILRESIEEKLGYPIDDTENLSFSSQFIMVPQELYQLI